MRTNRAETGFLGAIITGAICMQCHHLSSYVYVDLYKRLQLLNPSLFMLIAVRIYSNYGKAQKIAAYMLGKNKDLTSTVMVTFADKFSLYKSSINFMKLPLDGTITHIINVLWEILKFKACTIHDIIN